MDIYEQIIDILKKEYAAGATYQELADKYGVSYTHIHNLLHGKRAVSGISLDFFFRLFPKAAVSVNKILASEELSDSEKIKVLKVLKK